MRLNVIQVGLFAKNDEIIPIVETRDPFRHYRFLFGSVDENI